MVEQAETEAERTLRLERQSAHELELRREALARVDAEGGDRYLRQREVLALLGISRPTLWSWRKERLFPEPERLGPAGLLGWRKSVFDAWRAERMAARRAA